MDIRTLAVGSSPLQRLLESEFDVSGGQQLNVDSHLLIVCLMPNQPVNSLEKY